MKVQLINKRIDQDDISMSVGLLKYVSKFWRKEQWELYLKQLEFPNPEEEIYVGTTSELEKFVARKSENGFMPASSVEEGIEFKRARRK